MVIIQIFAIAACLTSIVSKWLYARRLSTLNTLLALEKRSYLIARKELKIANQACHNATSQEKQLEGQCNSIKRNLTQVNLVYNQIVNEQNKNKQKIEDQRRELETMG